MSTKADTRRRVTNVRWAVWFGFLSVANLATFVRNSLEHEPVVVWLVVATLAAAQAACYAGKAAE